MGKFRHNLEGTRLLKFDNFFPDGMGGEIKHEGAGNYDLGANPKFKANFSTSWSLAGIGAGLNVRYIHSFVECRAGNVQDDCGLSDAVARDIDANVTADAMVSYGFKNPIGQTMLTGGVNNVLDQDPPNIYNGFLATSDFSHVRLLGPVLLSAPDPGLLVEVGAATPPQRNDDNDEVEGDFHLVVLVSGLDAVASAG